jgi:hypothetical protein
MLFDIRHAAYFPLKNFFINENCQVTCLNISSSFFRLMQLSLPLIPNIMRFFYNLLPNLLERIYCGSAKLVSYDPNNACYLEFRYIFWAIKFLQAAYHTT